MEEGLTIKQKQTLDFTDLKPIVRFRKKHRSFIDWYGAIRSDYRVQLRVEAENRQKVASYVPTAATPEHRSYPALQTARDLVRIAAAEAKRERRRARV